MPLEPVSSASEWLTSRCFPLIAEPEQAFARSLRRMPQELPIGHMRLTHLSVWQGRTHKPAIKSEPESFVARHLNGKATFNSSESSRYCRYHSRGPKF